MLSFVSSGLHILWLVLHFFVFINKQASCYFCIQHNAIKMIIFNILKKKIFYLFCIG